MDPHQLAMTALRALAVYAFVLLLIRLLGKRTVGNFSAFDLLVALMLGEVVDEIIYADVSLAQGAVALGTIALAQFGNAWLSYWNHGMDRVLEGTPSVVVRSGAFERQGMRKERMNEKDVMAELRIRGVSELAEVRLAVVENDGQVSVAFEDWAEPARRADVGAAAEPARGSERTTDDKYLA
jgi:uncharacterized membrane protein YcaP (DUF421 family)